jgi:hypothetical protein
MLRFRTHLPQKVVFEDGNVFVIDIDQALLMELVKAAADGLKCHTQVVANL